MNSSLGYTFGALRSALSRRWRGLGRARNWVVQGLVALPGLVLLCLPGQDATVKCLGLAVIVLAGSLPCWRAPEENLPDPLRFRELNRLICWRGSVLLLLAGLLLASVRDGASTATTALLWTSPLPRLADQLAWQAWPLRLRQAARVAELLGDITRDQPTYRNRLISGMPQPFFHLDAEPPSAKACSTLGKKRHRKGHTVIHWDGQRLTVTDEQGRVHPVSLVGRADVPAKPPTPGARRIRPVAGMVWLTRGGARSGASGRTTLLFLDAAGDRAVTVNDMRCLRENVAQVARAAGLPFAAYDLGFAGERQQELAGALFPNGADVLTCYG